MVVDSSPKELAVTLENAIAQLNESSPDGAAERNDAGFNSHHVVPGRFLAASAGYWNADQVRRAYDIATVYRRTQLSHLPWDELDAFFREPDAGHRAVQERQARTDEEAEAIVEGIPWNKEREVRTRTGIRFLATARPTEEFWALWRTRKEWLRERNISVAKNDKDWQVTRWRKPDAGDKIEKVHGLDHLEPHASAPPRPRKTEEKLFRYQHEPVARLMLALKRFNAALDASDTGVGKTYVGLAAVHEHGRSPLVVAPKAVQTSWKRVAEQHFGIAGVRVVTYDKARAKKSPYGRWAAGRGGKEYFVWNDDVDTIIFDEAHRCKSHRTRNGRLMAAARRQNIMTLALSATAANNPLEMKNLGYLLGLHDYRGFWQWATRYGARPSRWGGYEFVGGQHHVAALHDLIFPGKGSRVTAEELGDLMPENRVVGRVVDIEKPKELDEAWDRAEMAMANIRTASEEDEEHHLTLLLRARQMSEAKKLPAFFELASDAVAEGCSPVVFLNFSESIAQFSSLLTKAKIPFGVIDGKTKQAERDKVVDGFAADTLRCVICNVAAGGEGIGLHDQRGEHPRVSFISPTWSDRQFKQLLGRIPRAGGKTKCVQSVVWAAGTCEEDVLNALGDKLGRLDSFNDGSLEPSALFANVV